MCRTITDGVCEVVSTVMGEELLDASRALARDSCLGEDGLPPSFFFRYWDLIAEGIRLAV